MIEEIAEAVEELVVADDLADKLQVERLVARELGYGEDEAAKLLESGAVVQGGPENFPWAPVRNKG